MSPGPEKGESLPAVVHYLKSIGVHVPHWTASPSQEKTRQTPVLSRGVFGVPLHLLPLSEHVDGVPQFLVNACDQLRPHLHVEGLFRKCGSMTRIKALKTRLEAGENCLEMALPCDVATLVKQFLRDLPEPLIPTELQAPLCEVQQQEDSDLRGPLTVLLTYLFPQGSVHTLRYLFTFLQEVAARSAQNKMDLTNLAIVFAPNLFPSELCSKLDGRAEEQLQKQAAVIQALIGHASEIGTVPQPLLEKVQASFSGIESQRLSPSGTEDDRDRDAETRRRWHRRRSVGDIVTETLSKLKTGRALCRVPCQETKDCAWKEGSPNNASLKTSFNSKRKASDDASWIPELSVKKRRSILDAISSDPSEDAGDPLDQSRAGGPRSPAPVFSSSSPPNPVSMGSQAASPQVPAVTIQRKQSSCRNKPQRKRSFRTTQGCSPTPFQRKDTGRKSLRIFFRSSKYPMSPVEQPQSVSDKAAEPTGRLLVKKTVMDTLEGSTSQQKWAQLPSSYKLKESGKGSPNTSSNEDPSAITCKYLQGPDTLENCQQGAGLSPCLDGISCLPQEPDLSILHGRRGLLGKTESSVVKDSLSSPPLGCHRVLRRSLSWPEDLSTKNAAEQSAFSPDEPLISPGEPETQMGSVAQPDIEGIVAGMRQLGIPAVCVTPADNCRTDNPVSEASPLLSKHEAPEARITLASRLRHLNEVPKTSLKHFSLTFQRPSPQANEGLNITRSSPSKRKARHRFSRSVSHESNLPLQTQEKMQSGSTAKRGAAGLPHKSPLQSFKACGQQIFLTRKHIAMSFTGLRRKTSKDQLPPSPQNPELLAAISREPVLERPNHCSTKLQLGEMQF